MWNQTNKTREHEGRLLYVGSKVEAKVSKYENQCHKIVRKQTNTKS